MRKCVLKMATANYVGFNWHINWYIYSDICIKISYKLLYEKTVI
jgi:hypothetical protein